MQVPIRTPWEIPGVSREEPVCYHFTGARVVGGYHEIQHRMSSIDSSLHGACTLRIPGPVRELHKADCDLMEVLFILCTKISVVVENPGYRWLNICSNDSEGH